MLVATGITTSIRAEDGYMGFTKINAVSLTDLFIQQIENMILSSELEIGEKLPTERELSVKMGVSRPVVSSGITELEKLGFVEVIPRQGVYVCDYRRKGSMETLEAIMRYNNGALRKGEVKALLEIRTACEQLCVKLVLENNSSEEIESVLGPILDNVGAAKDPDEAAECLFSFYHELAVMSGNVILPLFYYSFREQGKYLWSIFCKKNGVQKMYDLKMDFFSKLLNRDLEGCKNHITTVLTDAIDELSLYGA